VTKENKALDFSSLQCHEGNASFKRVGEVIKKRVIEVGGFFLPSQPEAK